MDFLVYGNTHTPQNPLCGGRGGANKTATGEQERATRYSTSRISQFSEKALDIALPEYLSHVLHKGMAIHSCVGGSRAPSKWLHWQAWQFERIFYSVAMAQ